MKALLCLALTGFVAGTSVQGDVATTSEVTPLPPVAVEGVGNLQEAAPVGPYSQPEWTTARRFPTTRVYLQQMPGEVGAEQWMKAQWPRGESANFLFQEEVEVGLPYRFQADFYENWIIDKTGKVMHDSVSAELRWALADWGKIPGNPTLYGEWTFRNHALGADKYELKLLLGDQITPRWHWGANFIYEQEVGATRTTELGASGAIGYTLVDQKLSLGLELKIESETTQGARGPAPIEVDLGPSLQWRPTRNTHLDVVPLVGLTSDSPRVESWVVFGFDFGSSNEKGHAPVSTRSN